MSEQEKQENQKTIVAFAAGLLIGGLLVWVFGGATRDAENTDDTNATTTELVGEEVDINGGDTDNDDEDADDEEETPARPELQTGTGAAQVSDEIAAGSSVALESATFPSDEGWIGVRDYTDGQIGGILGVARFSKVQGLVPEEIILQRPTRAGNTYAVVFFSENGDRIFNTANDKQAEGVVETFTVSDK